MIIIVHAGGTVSVFQIVNCQEKKQTWRKAKDDSNVITMYFIFSDKMDRKYFENRKVSQTLMISFMNESWAGARKNIHYTLLNIYNLIKKYRYKRFLNFSCIAGTGNAKICLCFSATVQSISFQLPKYISNQNIRVKNVDSRAFNFLPVFSSLRCSSESHALCCSITTEPHMKTR